ELLQLTEDFLGGLFGQAGQEALGRRQELGVDLIQEGADRAQVVADQRQPADQVALQAVHDRVEHRPQPGEDVRQVQVGQPVDDVVDQVVRDVDGDVVEVEVGERGERGDAAGRVAVDLHRQLDQQLRREVRVE